MGSPARPATRLRRLAETIASDELVELFDKRRHAINAALTFPPPASRGQAYTPAEVRRVRELVPDYLPLWEARREAARLRDEIEGRHGPAAVRSALRTFACFTSPAPWVRLDDLAFRVLPQAVEIASYADGFGPDDLAGLLEREVHPRIDSELARAEALAHPAVWSDRSAVEARRAVLGRDLTEQLLARLPEPGVVDKSPPPRSAERKRMAWTALATAFAAAEEHEGDAGALQRALPALGRRHPIVRVLAVQAGQLREPRPHRADVKHVLDVKWAGHRFLGPRLPYDQAYRGLRAMAEALASLPADATTSMTEWDRHVAVARRRVEEPSMMTRTNPAPGLGYLPDSARRVSPRLGAWVAAAAPELAAVLFQQGRWSTRWPTGWTTSAWRVAGQDEVSRVDEGTIDAWVVPPLRPGPDAPDGVVTIWRDLQDGPLIAANTRQALDAARDAADREIRVRVVYRGGSDAHGRVIDPATGRWVAWTPGRVVDVDLNTDPDAAPTWERARVRAVQAQDAWGHYPVTVVLDRTGAVYDLPDWAIRMRPEPLDAPPPRRNPASAPPGHRVTVAYDRSGAFKVRHARGDARLVAAAERVMLTDAALLPSGIIEGVLVDTDESAPDAPGGWAPAGGVPGQWTAIEVIGQPGTMYLSAGRARAPRPVQVRVNRAPATGTPPDRLFDAEGRDYAAHYEVVEAAMDGSTLATSHQPSDLTSWTPGYPREFQTRDLGSPQEQSKIQAIARRLDPTRLLGRHLDATMGAPVAWEGPDGRLYTVAGNGRALAVLLAPEDRYEAYLSEGRRRWTCWPREPARPGHRWVLVRVARGIDQAAATRLAAASQLSTSAEEGRIGKALGLVRSLGLDIAKLPPVEWTRPIDTANIGDFALKNRAFTEHVLAQIDPAKRALHSQDGALLARLMESVMIGFLPEPVRRGGLLSDPKTEDALLGALPGMATLRSLITAGAVYPAFDLLAALPEAIDVFRYLRQHRITFTRLAEQLRQEMQTVRLADSERLSDTSDLALALAAALHNAAGRSAPADVMAKRMADYLGVALQYNPAQRGLFGGPSIPDPARVLADTVAGFDLPKRTRRNPPQRDAPDRAHVRWLEFDRSMFPSGSDCRAWAKAHRYRPSVPQMRGDRFALQQSAEPGGDGGRRVELGEGVWAVVR